jgi:hypothetical protein
LIRPTRGRVGSAPRTGEKRRWRFWSGVTLQAVTGSFVMCDFTLVNQKM